MADNSTILLSSNEKGDETRVDVSVLEVILGIAARKVDGVSEMRGSLKAGINRLFGRTNRGKGVSIHVDDGKLTADIYVYLNYGVNVPQVAMNLQKKLTLQLEQMTSLKLDDINIHVVGLISEDENSYQDTEELFTSDGEAQK
ncbi:Asp23/Gls24 family envelope stress response protein [Lactobacillus sp. PV037]|uniref:Asp23/Gls24 family envelope stress response protein n=1 Tax=unclassified Lactobacillus TaxID=2620435 RepID=UPI00223F770A|nr:MULTISPECIES: Asp23/Gls24 family envelope stress response protein [unclassified Lactobacillus]QNQ82076.1 Asp23/Gls24 family envelope stress response protein [Lactobacillus sp. PV012]QNQ83889.1 Asp23/Gls24 family envelope stress response protein [Lactobacillus sp. PV037]